MSDPVTAFTVLIVDDTPANLSVLLQCLSEVGHHVLIAEDGEEALDLLARRIPDLVLLDVMMPGIDGFETCRQLKQNPATADVPVIFMTALTDTREKLQGFAAGAVDYITKPIQHEEALARVATHLSLRRLQRQIADELAIKQRFMRIASHDLRNPLCLASFSTALSRRALNKPAALGSHLDEIDAAIDQMRRIIDTFLELKPAGQGKPVNIATLAEAVVSQHQSVAEAKAQTLHCMESPADLPMVKASSALLYQIITNFVSNALKFSPHGGEIALQLTPQNARIVRIAVQDNGPGVPPAERSQLFEENVHLSPRPTGDEESHGFGLSVAKQLAAQLGGTVGAEFPNVGGSVFWCDLPSA